MAASAAWGSGVRSGPTSCAEAPPHRPDSQILAPVDGEAVDGGVWGAERKKADASLASPEVTPPFDASMGHIVRTLFVQFIFSPAPSPRPTPQRNSNGGLRSQECLQQPPGALSDQSPSELLPLPCRRVACTDRKCWCGYRRPHTSHGCCQSVSSSLPLPLPLSLLLPLMAPRARRPPTASPPPPGCASSSPGCCRSHLSTASSMMHSGAPKQSRPAAPTRLPSPKHSRPAGGGAARPGQGVGAMAAGGAPPRALFPRQRVHPHPALPWPHVFAPSPAPQHVPGPGGVRRRRCSVLRRLMGVRRKRVPRKRCARPARCSSSSSSSGDPSNARWHTTGAPHASASSSSAPSPTSTTPPCPARCSCALRSAARCSSCRRCARRRPAGQAGRGGHGEAD